MPRPKKAAPTATNRTYTIYFVLDEETGGYTAHIPALDIVTEGQSLPEATAMAKDAIAALPMYLLFSREPPLSAVSRRRSPEARG
jgi:predicted RNase H-like HicB family nuclease